MSYEEVGKIWKLSDSVVMTVPAKIVNDGLFPFKLAEVDGRAEPRKVVIKLDTKNKRRIVEDYKEAKEKKK